MALPREKSLHAFFKKPQAIEDVPRSISSAEVVQSKANDAEPHHDADAPIESDTAVASSRDNPSLEVKNEKPKKKRARKVKVDTQAKLEGPTVQTTPAPEVETAPAAIEGIVDIEDDASHNSKRRKLTPPPQTGSWFDQLQQNSLEKRIKKLESVKDIENTARQAVSVVMDVEQVENPKSFVQQEPSRLPAKEAQESINSNLDFSSAKTAHATNSADRQHGESDTQKKSDKLLRLNGKGRFNFPVLKETVQIAEDRVDAGKSVPSKRGRKRKSLIAILRYGFVASPGRVLLGQRIEQILGGVSKSDAKDSVAVDMKHINIPLAAPQPATQGFRPSRPPKSTHPFFLGKAGPPVSIVKALDSAVSTDHQEQSHPVLPSFTTPGKLKAHRMSKSLDHGGRGDENRFTRPLSIFRLPGTFDPAWPPLGQVRVDICTRSERRASEPKPGTLKFTQRKRKQRPQSVVQEEQVLSLERDNLEKKRKILETLPSRQLPQRLVVSGTDIQSRILKQLDENQHPAARKLRKALPSASTPFDIGQGEGQAWTSKYSPRSTGDVLQNSAEMSVLKQWLERHTVTHVEGSSNDHGSSTKSNPSEKAERKEKVHGRRKRSRHDELDDFIVASDEDDSEMLPLGSGHDLSVTPGKRYQGSLIRDQHGSSSKPANAILLNGPSGCGKTAAVFAVARELGFEIFEINSGSRRNGKDILDKVGSMTLNHQVRKQEVLGAPPIVLEIDDLLPAEPEEHQATLTTFFAAKAATKPTKKQSSKVLRQAEEKIAQAAKHKQSLILLEEVDILYDEDKQFWDTVMELALHSKRPLIMTCTDESMVPLRAVSLHAILRLRPPAVNTAVDYLLVLAATEGHLVQRETIEALYKARRHDLRATITELNFWCQMAIGAPKAGVDWYLPRWPPGCDQDTYGQKLRVVSSESVPPKVNIFGGTELQDDSALQETWREFGIDPSVISAHALEVPKAAADTRLTPHDQHAFLVEYSQCLDIQSAVDVFATVDLPQNALQRDIIDPTQPPITSKTVADFIEGYPVLQAETRTDFEQTDMQLAVDMHLGIKRYFESQLAMFTSSTATEPPESVQDYCIRTILEQPEVEKRSQQLSRKEFSTAFDPISEPPSTHSSVIPTHTALSTSSFDRPFALVTTDLAPYVRSIVQYDQQLEQQRQRLTELLSGLNNSNKRQRTTRASRSALQGSKRATTRRERWFEAKTLDSDVVLRTGGQDWPKVTKSMDWTPTASAEGASRASSADPLGGE